MRYVTNMIAYRPIEKRIYAYHAAKAGVHTVQINDDMHGIETEKDDMYIVLSEDCASLMMFSGPGFRSRYEEVSI